MAAAAFHRGLFARHLQKHAKNIAVPASSRAYATKAEKKKGLDRKLTPKIDPSADSLAAKGFLRSQKAYQPPNDLTTRLQSIFETTVGTTDSKTALSDINKKFAVFTACFNEFQHSIPSSLLHTIGTLKDVEDFYAKPLKTITPYDNLKNLDLPPNLNVQYEYHRFHPDTDTKFGGVTAYPRSSTIVSGLKYKDKYKGHWQGQDWPNM